MYEVLNFFRSSPSAVSGSLPRIISYLPLVDLSIWHFHVTIFFALKSGKKKYTFSFFEVVNFLAWISRVVSNVYFVFCFDISLMLPLSNRIRKNLNFTF